MLRPRTGRCCPRPRLAAQDIAFAAKSMLALAFGPALDMPPPIGMGQRLEVWRCSA